MLKTPIRIFWIINKQVINDKVIRFFLNDNIIYSENSFNLIHCANSSPFNSYQIGDYLGISINEIEGSDFSSSSSDVFDDTGIVTKVVKYPTGYNGTTISDLVFGLGWAEEENIKKYKMN